MHQQNQTAWDILLVWDQEGYLYFTLNAFYDFKFDTKGSLNKSKYSHNFQEYNAPNEETFRSTQTGVNMVMFKPRLELSSLSISLNPILRLRLSWPLRIVPSRVKLAAKPKGTVPSSDPSWNRGTVPSSDPSWNSSSQCSEN